MPESLLRLFYRLYYMLLIGHTHWQVDELCQVSYSLKYGTSDWHVAVSSKRAQDSQYHKDKP